MSDNTLTLLGTSSGVPQPNRVCSGAVLQVGSELLLIDCGGGVTSAFLRAGFDFRDVTTIIISHSHSDHVCELSLFLQGMYLARKEGRVTVYLPEEFVAEFKRYLTAVYLFPERFPFQFEIQGYAGRLELARPTRIRSFPNSHLRKYEPFLASASGANRMQSHSFIIETGGTRLLYTADIGSGEDVLPYLEGVTCLVTELSHVDREAYLSAVKERGVERVVVTHIDGDDVAEEMVEIAGKVGIANLETAFDGMRLTL